MKVGSIENKIIAPDKASRSSGTTGRETASGRNRLEETKLRTRLEKRSRREKLKREEKVRKLRQKARETRMEYSGYSRKLNYKKHKATDRYFVRVIDESSNEVVREVPPREELDRIAKMLQYLRTKYGMNV